MSTYLAFLIAAGILGAIAALLLAVVRFANVSDSLAETLCWLEVTSIISAITLVFLAFPIPNYHWAFYSLVCAGLAGTVLGLLGTILNVWYNHSAGLVLTNLVVMVVGVLIMFNLHGIAAAFGLA